jgi:hypothetical protein
MRVHNALAALATSAAAQSLTSGAPNLTLNQTLIVPTVLTGDAASLGTLTVAVPLTEAISVPSAGLLSFGASAVVDASYPLTPGVAGPTPTVTFASENSVGQPVAPVSFGVTALSVPQSVPAGTPSASASPQITPNGTFPAFTGAAHSAAPNYALAGAALGAAYALMIFA